MTTAVAAAALTVGVIAPSLAAEAPFGDRDAIADVHVDNVDRAHEAGIVDGYEDDTFRPDRAVPRDQMASFIERTLEAADVELPAVSAGADFGDIDGNVHADAILRLEAAGIVHGVTEERYAPEQLVRRDQTAAFVLRSLAFARDVDVAELAADDVTFDDARDSVHVDEISGAYRRGIVKGYDDGTFAPAEDTSREQMASLVLRLLDTVDTRSVTELDATTFSAGDSLTGTIDADDVASVTVDGAGLEDEEATLGTGSTTFSVDLPDDLEDGEHEVTVTITYDDGEEETVTFTITIDSTVGATQLTDAEFSDAGEDRVFGDTEGDVLTLTFDGELDGTADDADARVVVSDEDGGDLTLEQSDALEFEVDGSALVVGVTDTEGVEDVTDIHYRWVTDVAEVYDTDGDEVEVPEDGVQIGDFDADASPAELQEVAFDDAGEERTFGDAVDDTLTLTFDGELDEYALGRDGDPQVVVSDEDGGDITIQRDENVAFEIEGDTLTLRVEDDATDDVTDIHYRWVTIVDEVYDTNGNEVEVPEDGVKVGDFDADAEPAELTDATLTLEGDEDVYGDAEGDSMTLTFDGELDEFALGRDGDPQVTVSTLEGTDLTLTDGEGVVFEIDGQELVVEVDDPANIDDIDDIRNRRVTIVDEVYDANDNQVTVPDDGVWLDEAPATLEQATFTDAGDDAVFGDTEGDELVLDFDTELDRVNEDADGQVTVSDAGGDDINLQESEALTFTVDGTELTLTVENPGNVTDVDDITERDVTIVDEVYDVNGFEVTVPEDGVSVQ